VQRRQTAQWTWRTQERGPLVCAAVCLLVVLQTTAARAQDSAPAKTISLAEALSSARESFEGYQLSREQLERVRLMRDRAWAALAPTLLARGTFTLADKEIAIGDRVLQRQDYFAGSLQAALSLFRGPAIPDLIGSYQRAEAAELSLRWTQADLDFEVARAYYAALATENLLQASQRSLRTAEEHLSAVQARRAAGEALGVDEARAKSEVVAARGTLTRTDNAQETSLDLLAFLTGHERHFTLTRPEVTSLPGPGGDDEPELQLTLRPDLRATQLEVQAAYTAVTSAWMSYLPSLSLVGAFDASQNTGWSGEPYSWRLVAALEWQLIDGGLRRASRLERASLLRSARLRAQQLERAVTREQRQASRDVDTATSTLTTARERLELAGQTQEMVMSRYRAGLATSLEIVEADDSLRQAEVAVVAEELNLALRRLDLLRAHGRNPLARAIEEDHAASP